MIPELIVYNYCTDELSQAIAVGYVTELLEELESKEVPTSFLKVVDGNKEYKETHFLIAKVFDYWHKPGEQLPTWNIYLSFQCLQGYLETGNWKDSCHLGKDKNLEIINLAVDKKITPRFFNSILITGKNFKLEHPYGVFPPRCTIKVGGICINRCIAKQSIWHETAHLLGADECYDVNDPQHRTLESCTHPKCFMQRDSTKGQCFCDKSIAEMREFILKACKNENKKA
jgi:hypothetical protein